MPDMTPHRRLTGLLSLAGGHVARDVAQILKGHDTSPEQWRVLNLLADGAGHSMTEIAHSTFVASPTLTRLIDRMTAENLVYRKIDPEDRRRCVVFMSARGGQLHARLREDVEGYETELAAGCSAADLDHLAALLTQLISTLERTPRGPTGERDDAAPRGTPGARADASRRSPGGQEGEPNAGQVGGAA